MRCEYYRALQPLARSGTRRHAPRPAAARPRHTRPVHRPRPTPNRQLLTVAAGGSPPRNRTIRSDARQLLRPSQLPAVLLHSPCIAILVMDRKGHSGSILTRLLAPSTTAIAPRARSSWCCVRAETMEAPMASGIVSASLTRTTLGPAACVRAKSAPKFKSCVSTTKSLRAAYSMMIRSPALGSPTVDQCCAAHPCLSNNRTQSGERFMSISMFTDQTASVTSRSSRRHAAYARDWPMSSRSRYG